MRFAGVMFLGFLICGLEPVWAGQSILEDPGVVSGEIIDIADDYAANGFSGNTVTLSSDGTITGDWDRAVYTITGGYTLNVADTTTLSVISHGAQAYLETYGTGILDIANGGHVILGANTNLINEGRITNAGTITFDEGARRYYNGGIINNASGTIQIAFNNLGRDDILIDLDGTDAGTIQFTSGNVESSGFSNTSFTDGTFIFDAAQNTSAAINVGGADIVFAGGGIFGASVTASTITVKDNDATFNAKANGDLDIQADTTYNSTFSSHDISVSGDSILTLGTDAVVTISATKKLDIANDGSTLINKGILAFENGATYTVPGGAGTIDNSAGTIKMGLADANCNAILADLATTDAGTIEFTSGDVSASGFNQTGFAAGTFKFNDAQNPAAAIDVGTANVEFAGGGVFGANVTAAKITTKGTSTFNTGIMAYGDLDVQADTNYDAAFSDNNIDVSNNSTLTLGTSANVTISSGKTLSMESGSTINNDGTIAFSDSTARYVKAGVPGTVDNADGTIKIALSHTDLSDLLGDMKTADAGTIELTGSNPTSNLTGNFSAGSFKFSDTMNTTNSINVGSADVNFANGGTFGGDVTAKSISFGASSTIAAALAATESIEVTGTATFLNGSSITLEAGATVTATTYDFTSLSEGGLTLTLNGDQTDWVNETLFNNVTDNSVFSTGRYRTAVTGGNQLEITSYIASAAEVLGPYIPNDMSINISNGFNLLDVIDADAAVAQPLKDALNDATVLIEDMLKSPSSYGRGLRAQRQRQGEYGNASREALFTTTALFGKRLDRRLDANIDLHFGLNVLAAAPASDNAYASLYSVRSRNGGYDYCAPSTTIWADFHGGWAKQKAKSNINGYDYDGYGVSIGAERRLGRLLLGVAGGYTRAGVDVDDLSTDYDADVMNLGVYAGYVHESGFFARAGLGFAYAWNDYDVSMALGPNKKGDFDSQAYTANLDLGYVFRTPAVNLIPSVGLRYTHIRQDDWRESGGQLGTVGFFEKKRYNAVDIPVALRINRVFESGCLKIAPEARVAWVYAAKKNRSEINYGIQGAGYTATMHGVNPGRNRYQVGAGVKAEWRDKYEFSLDYDYEFRSKYQDHKLSVNFGVAF